MADNSEKILNGTETRSQQEPFVDIYKQCCCMSCRDLQSNSLLACGWKEPHHLHGQLKPLKVML